MVKLNDKQKGMYELAIMLIHLGTNFGMAQIQLVEDDY